MIEYKDTLVPILHVLFNGIFNTGYFPKIVSDAFFVPISKKGSTSDTANHRGISLLSNLLKLITSVINTRLLNWASTYDVITDAQFGFRPGFGTVDAIFALNSVVNKCFNNKKRLYCCFVDYKKALDTIDREKLWSKMYRLGIRGKIMSTLKSMYNNIKACVLLNGTFSNFFNNTTGVLQVEEICSRVNPAL